MAKRKQSWLQKSATGLLAIGLGLVILGIPDPWTEDRFWGPLRADARTAGVIAILAGIIGWLYLRVPRIAADAAKLWRRSKVGGGITLALGILLATALVRFNLVRIEGAPLFFIIFLSLILLLGCQILLEIALSMTNFLDRAVHHADERPDGSSAPRR